MKNKYNYLPIIKNNELDLSELVLFLDNNNVTREDDVEVRFYDLSMENKTTLNLWCEYRTDDVIVINSEGYIESYMQGMIKGKGIPNPFNRKDEFIESLISNKTKIVVDIDAYKSWVEKTYKDVGEDKEENYTAIWY